MAWQLASTIVNPSTGGSLAGGYLKITGVNICRRDATEKLAVVTMAVWANEAASKPASTTVNGVTTTTPPLQPLVREFEVNLASTEYAAVVGAAPGATATPLTAENAVVANLYAALPTCGDTFTKTLTAGATQC